jgi:uncharacterized phage-associated protein
MFGRKKEKKHPASHSAAEAANLFIKLAKAENKTLTNMQLQKLVYIAHGFFLALLGEALFDDRVEAWDFGPVIPNLYHKLKKYGAGAVTDYLESENQIERDSAEAKIIENVWESYRQFSPEELSAMTHTTGTPWSSHYIKGERNTTIPNHSIRDHYQKLARE